MSDPTWLRISSMNDILDGARLVKDLRGHQILLFRRGDQVFAYEDRCPHKGAPLGDGRLNKSCITCRHHQWEFDLLSGKSTRPLGHTLKSYSVKIENGEIFVSL